MTGEPSRLAPPGRDGVDPAHRLRGRAWCRAWASEVDRWLAAEFAAGPLAELPVELVAIGGHGRGELAPGSDLDLMLLHDGSVSRELTGGFWYPVWDLGVKLGHSVRTPREALALAGEDLDTATALLSARVIAGDRGLGERVRIDARAAWASRWGFWSDRLSASTTQRHASSAPVAFALEPDLKDGRGGLRDVDALAWAELAGVHVGFDQRPVAAAADLLVDVRVELQRHHRRAGNVLVLQEQDDVAASLGLHGSDDLMARVAAAGRTIAWAGEDLWFDIEPARPGRGRRSPAQRIPGLPAGVEVRGRRLVASEEVASRPGAAFALAALAARHGLRLDQTTAALLGAAPPPGDPWPPEVLADFISLLAAGRGAIEIIETIDRCGAWSAVLPEWEHTRSRPQRNPYHRFTVDRHLLEATAFASELLDRVERPDLLLLGALFHDIGKGLPGDHTEVGIVLVERIGRRMGLGVDDLETVVFLVEQHLLLADVATRRDLDDPATVDLVSTVVGRLDRLDLLAVLSEADGRATGSTAWTSWKAGLVAELVERVRAALGVDVVQSPGRAERVTGGASPDVVAGLVVQARGSQRPAMFVDGDRLTVASVDRPGVFARVTGGLAVAGLDVLEASASAVDEVAVDTFRVSSTLGNEIDWPAVEGLVASAVSGRLAIDARLAERARSYRSGRRPPVGLAQEVRVFNDASSSATVIEVVGPDRIGLLSGLTRALSDLDLDIRTAKVATLGHDVVDTFYVTDDEGRKVTDRVHLAEIRVAIRHELDRPGM